jgi:hypothetical protein
MAQIAPPNNVVLHCEIEIEGKTIWVDTLISRRSWDVADERTREAMRESAQESLAHAIVRQCNPPVTVTVPAVRPAVEED